MRRKSIPDLGTVNDKGHFDISYVRSTQPPNHTSQRLSSIYVNVALSPPVTPGLTPRSVGFQCASRIGVGLSPVATLSLWRPLSGLRTTLEQVRYALAVYRRLVLSVPDQGNRPVNGADSEDQNLRVCSLSFAVQYLMGASYLVAV